MTHTQSYRFNQISGQKDVSSRPSDNNPLDDARYPLSDAAFRLMISEEEVLAKAVAGALRLYVDVAGMSGHWCRCDEEGNVSQTSQAGIDDNTFANLRA